MQDLRATASGGIVRSHTFWEPFGLYRTCGYSAADLAVRCLKRTSDTPASRLETVGWQNALRGYKTAQTNRDPTLGVECWKASNNRVPEKEEKSALVDAVCRAGHSLMPSKNLQTNLGCG